MKPHSKCQFSRCARLHVLTVFRTGKRRCEPLPGEDGFHKPQLLYDARTVSRARASPSLIIRCPNSGQYEGHLLDKKELGDAFQG